MDDLRRVPPPFPPLALRERGNFISVRQKPDQDAGWGTLNNPKRFELPLLTPHQLRSTLGYEAEPASEFWQFTVTMPIELQVNRISDDRYASCVGVALLDQNNRRVAPLVQSAGGRGAAVQLQSGTYKVCVSLGIAERLKDLRLEFNATPIGGVLQSAARWQVGIESAEQQGAALAGVALAEADASATAATVLLRSAATPPQLLPFSTLMAVAPRSLMAEAERVVNAAAVLQVLQPIELAAARCVTAGGRARLTAVRWLAEPHRPWQLRQSAEQPPVLEINSAYVRLDGDQAAIAAVLEQLRHTLTPAAPTSGDGTGAENGGCNPQLDPGQSVPGTADGDLPGTP